MKNILYEFSLIESNLAATPKPYGMVKCKVEIVKLSMNKRYIRSNSIKILPKFINLNRLWIRKYGTILITLMPQVLDLVKGLIAE